MTFSFPVDLFLDIYSVSSNLQRPTDSAVLTDSPKVNRQQQRHTQRDGDTVQDVETIESFFTYHARTQQPKARIGGVGYHPNPVNDQ